MQINGGIMEEKIAALEKEVASLKQLFGKLVTEAWPALKHRVDAHSVMYKEWEEGTGKFAAKSNGGSTRQRRTTNYHDWKLVMDTQAEAEPPSMTALARRLGMPVSTVRKYLTMTPEEVQRLKEKTDKLAAVNNL